MKRVFKYDLEVSDRQTLALPRGAKILSVGLQHGNIKVWALVDDTYSETEDRTFVMHGTGHNADDVVGLQFIGTVIMLNDNLVFHVFAN